MQKQLKRGSTYARMSAKSSAEIRKFRFWKGGQYRPEYADGEINHNEMDFPQPHRKCYGNSSFNRTSKLKRRQLSA